MTIEIVDFFPLKTVIFNSYVSLPEGKSSMETTVFFLTTVVEQLEETHQ